MLKMRHCILILLSCNVILGPWVPEDSQWDDGYAVWTGPGGGLDYGEGESRRHGPKRIHQKTQEEDF